MRLHDISETHAHRKSKRVGRGNGSGKGTFAGRGVKGQKARTGANSNIPRTFIGGSTTLIQRLPKLKGFKSAAVKPVTVNIARVVANYTDGDKVTLLSLLEKGIISAKEAAQGVKIVGASGEVTHKLTFDTENGKLSVTKKLLA
ncbi:MAG TPA: 50S ribosomal protein L15 [Verrucomicrobiae bacterium]|nr:50S ribosomal protein L15 [Verrucomicrobiae bacterium]